MSKPLNLLGLFINLQTGGFHDWTRNSPALKHTFPKALEIFYLDQDEKPLQSNNLYNGLGREVNLEPVAKLLLEGCLLLKVPMTCGKNPS